MKKKILIITPRSPFTNTGACEQDRLSGIEWFVNHDFEVRVITKAFESDHDSIEDYKKKLRIPITPVAYKYRKKGLQKFLTILRRLIWPPFWDGASFEYFDRETQEIVKKEAENFNPDYVWFDYTYLWPLYNIFIKKSIPILTRSINFEPTHFLDEDGRNIFNYIRSFPKYISEYLSFSRSNYFFPITPKEEKIYKRFGNTPVKILPLRALPHRVNVERRLLPHHGVCIGFMPSTYNVHHNREALRFLVEDVLPLLPADVRGLVTLHITGSKFPKELEGTMPKEVIYEGFVPSVVDFWMGMDMAVSPSIFGAGMQQKIFEPISLGIPTITSKRGLAGYPFETDEVICAETKEEVSKAIEMLVNDRVKMKALGIAGKIKAQNIFSQSVIDEILNRAFNVTNNSK